ncbi:hypothetical protein AMTRI_Chr05g65820 [Amborella trichopoda]|uniref:Receptor-like serine/threonine-protein kinase n=1 Tax=Amborella trichopoda TaxID=13333 RepID=W1P824_AMBTC|nr:G-type lectin S-receptor-like serine/threonine-protein kinase SD2-5 [Amborella trichopoda]ERN03731.1 hypothetical protein AMTR_s00078p00034300 [Amborella trichopoda]|eukprot:XP_006842056.3 G-type lectin S-receptor-like serine/threonine-protein kinase SD2-5 [Amborella trichopoda]
MAKRIMAFVNWVGGLYMVLIISSRTSLCATPNSGRIEPGFRGSQMNWIDNQGSFLFSKGQSFVCGFRNIGDVTLFTLSVWHVRSLRVVWTANRDSPVRNSDDFVFSEDGNTYLESNGSPIWSTNTSEKGGSSLELQDSGNLVLLTNDSRILWQSFANPTDTLLSGQNFTQGMELVSNSSSSNISSGNYHLRIDSGDMMLLIDFNPPQLYWSMQKDTRQTIAQLSGDIYSATLTSNSWMTYNKRGTLLGQVIFSGASDPNATWAAVLGPDGSISFYNLQSGGSMAESTTIPASVCQKPEICGPYYVCQEDSSCRCPPILSSATSCASSVVSSPCRSNGSVRLAEIGDGLSYFANDFISPLEKQSLSSCQGACQNNCSCIALFYDNSSRRCLLYSQLGSLQQVSGPSNGYAAYIKVSNIGDNGSSNPEDGGQKHLPIIAIIIIAVMTIVVIMGLIFLVYRYHRKRRSTESLRESSEDDTFLEGLSGMPVRYSYRELQLATNNFTNKLGQGGFGSVYQGVLPDGTRIAVKQLEGIGQGKKEFRAEVSIIGGIHHVHLVRLRGFCAEGTHRLLAYEYMAKGSLDKWIFRKDEGCFLLDWDTRYNIALATAKGLAYLHEDCNVKIVHCDIKPENVLLDDNFVAKVSDFGLAKLMTREQSHVFTTLRGTRGYLAPEWITNYAISEKSDVYSFGMVLLEIIGGRKNFDPVESSEKAHFPSYAFKKMEEGKLKDIIDENLHCDEKDERVEIAIRIALWCIQEDMSLRPPMTKVAQMLEGIMEVPQPPTSSQFGFRVYSNFLKPISEGGTSSDPSDCNSDAFLSAVRLSGPR